MLINIIPITFKGRRQTAVEREEWGSVIKEAKVFRGPYSQGVLLLLLLLLLLYCTTNKRILHI